jgi:two-component system, NarL family, sensor kinase
MKKLILFFVILAFVPNVHTQVTKIDSLQHLLKTIKEDTSKIDILNNLARELIYIDSDMSMDYSNQSITVSKKILKSTKNEVVSVKCLKEIAMSHRNIAKSYIQKGDYNKSLNSSFKSAKIYEDFTISKDEVLALFGKKWTAITYTDIGSSYDYLGNYLDAIDYHLKALKLFEEINDSKGIGIANNNSGIIHFNQGNYKEALKLFFNAIKINEKSKNYRGLAGQYSNVGMVYNGMGKYSEALEYYTKSEKIYKEIGEKMDLPFVYGGIANVYDNMKNFDKAIKFNLTSLQLYEEYGNKNGISVCYNNLGRIYFQKGDSTNAFKDYFKAIEYYKKALTLSKETETRKNIMNNYAGLSFAYSKIGVYDKAYEFHKRYTSLKDSLHNTETSKQISELQIRYDTEKKDQQIALLEKEKQITDTETKRKNILVASSVGGFVLIVLVLFLFYNRQQLKKQNLLQKELTGAVVKGQDEERKRIAKDLHDGLGTLLSTARINVNTLEDKIPVGNENKKLFDNALQIIDKLNSEVRYIAQNLMPETLNEFGLVAAVEELIDAINRTGKLKITFKHYELSNELEKQLEINLYRIIQEIVNNTIKHSKATQLSIELVQHEDSIVLLTEDNGIGFNTENKSQTGMGIKNIQARLNVFNGTLHIDSNPNNGTITTIEIPLLA